MEYRNGDTCPVCGMGQLNVCYIDEEFEQGGHKLTINDFEVYCCNCCKSELVSESTMKIHGQKIRDFHELNNLKVESTERRDEHNPW